MAPRRAAVHLLHAVTVLGRPLDGQLDRHLAGLSPSDRALARALTGGVLRHMPGLDSLIDSACAKPLPADARARQVLRVALAGRLLLDTPPHAAIATALPLVEGGPRRLVHGVLSTLFREGAELPPPSLPPIWAERWGNAWGEAEVAAAAHRLAGVPPTDLALKDAGRTAEWAEKLGAVSLMPGHLRLPGSQAVEALPGFDTGDWWVQDIAAGLPARLLGPVGGLEVLDLCAAPGGKTLQLAAAGARVTALDLSASRLKRLRANLQRTGLDAQVVEADALIWEPGRRFDAILLDAPCSATGTFRRHPDLLYLKADLDLGRLVALQSALMRQAARWLKPGGRLVYAVCSLEPAEGEGASPPAGLQADPVGLSELPPGLSPAGNTVRTLPSLWGEAGGADGFFIARYRAGA
nr:transcription antitermination factor NusB [Sandaracinobacteroides sayramensis]